MEKKIVGISDGKAVRTPEILVTYALGSCVGICLHDKIRGIGGLVHIMLPDSTAIKGGTATAMKFADTGVPAIINEMKKLGSLGTGLTAKIAGGALMFAANSERFNIGQRNIVAVRNVLREYRIPIVAEDVGLDYGRTIFFHTESGKVEVKSASKGIVVI